MHLPLASAEASCSMTLIDERLKFGSVKEKGGEVNDKKGLSSFMAHLLFIYLFIYLFIFSCFGVSSLIYSIFIFILNSLILNIVVFNLF